MMYALVDCNNFFVSAERLFRPDLLHKPVCVLSNNDGCIVSLSNEAKAVGIKRGDPLFKIKELVEKHQISIFSSNYLLYAGISSRVMNILGEEVKDLDVYSIDEAFLYLGGYEKLDVAKQMRNLVKKVQKWTGIPISIGVAPTKTLAKVAANYAKKYAGYQNVCLIDTEEKRIKALSRFDISKVWGVGRQSFKKLKIHDIQNAYEFSKLPEGFIKKHFTITGVRTWKELNGIPCIETSEITEKQSICTSRSFGTTITQLEPLKESVANFTSACAQKLRKQQSAANIISLFLNTDRFNPSIPQYYNYQSFVLPVPTAETTELIRYAHQLLMLLYKPGYAYKKAGIILSEIVPNTAIQQDFFDPVTDRSKRIKLNHVMDRINLKNGLNTIIYAIQEPTEKQWISKKEFISPNYLANIQELLNVK